MFDSDGLRRLSEEVASHEWYHTLELAPGVVTPGWFDLRDVAPRIPFPELRGKRCLDIGTFDGFWAFEMERRGAAEVLATDVIDPRGWDWPAGSEEATLAAIAERKAGGSGFELARRTLGSSVERIELSVYELDPAELGEFDVVYVGSLLLHLRDPVRALRQVRSVCAGALVLCDAIDPLTSLLRHRPVASLDGVGRPWWWKPNVAGLVRMVYAAGFEPTGPARRVRMPAGAGHPPAGRDPRLLLTRAGREHVARARRGEPHVALAATPRI